MSTVVFTAAGLRRGAIKSLPVMAGLTPFALVCGIVSQGVGMSWAEAILMAATVYAGASELLAMSAWAHPAPILGATAAAFVVNLRMALMGPVLSPWLDQLRGWRLWGSLFFLVDHGWAVSLKDMRDGGMDAAFFLGCCGALWIGWVAASAAGYALGAVLRPPPGHPIFFAALAAFIALLAGMWRGRGDLLPWAVAGATAVAVSRLLPNTSWHIVAGALAGSLTAAARDLRAKALPA